MERVSIPSPILKITRIKNPKIITSMIKFQINRTIAINKETISNIISANTKNKVRVFTKVLTK
jgi:hypothetical protein